MIARIALILVTLFSLGVLACSTAATPTPTLGPAAPATRLKVLSTVSPITSLVENIGGTRIDLEGVVPEGTNSHTFEPPPSLAPRRDLALISWT
jgi:ABC-type Zn uptake system ZnuABC Zn-binding protein ZnuA